MSKNNGLPTGIKYTSGAYRWRVTYKGQHVSGFHKLLNQAVMEREQALMRLKSAGNPNIIDLNNFVTSDNRRKNKVIKDDCPTLEEALNAMFATE